MFCAIYRRTVIARMADIYEMRAAVAKALAHPIRLQIIELLLDKTELCVCEIVKDIGESQSTISKHLRILKSAGLVDNRKDGLMVFYRLRVPCILKFFECLDRVLINDIEAKKAEFSIREDD